MTSSEYNELFDQLCYGHEAEVLYNGKKYFFEWEDLKLKMYDITESDGLKVRELTGIDRTSVFLLKK